MDERNCHMLGDFYNEAASAQFDAAMEQFKAQLRECVRDEWVNEMARLREENAKYADIKARWAAIEAERQREREEVNRIKSNAETHVRYARLAELFEEACSVVYTASSYSQMQPKCGKCDSDRLIHYKNPVTGKDVSETCPYCGHNISVFSPEKLCVYEAKMCNYYCSVNSLTVWYKDPNKEDGYLHTIQAFDDGKPFEDIKRYNSYFKSRERCQAYCDWLNERERNRESGDE